jgi:hypothetical protein
MTFGYKDFSTPSLAIPLKSPLYPSLMLVFQDELLTKNLNSFGFPVPVAPAIKP